MDRPSPITIAAADLLLQAVTRLASSTSVSADDVRQSAAEVFGAERMAFRLKDAAAVALLKETGDKLTAIATGRDRWPRLIDLHRVLVDMSVTQAQKQHMI
jgi:hypothetical protein